MAEKQRIVTTEEKEHLLDLYRKMALIRRFEEKCAELYASGDIGGFLHLYIGQEAVAVGAISAITHEDHVITAYRDHGHAIAVGSDVNKLMAEVAGKSTGISKGKGGSMHLADVSKNYWGGYAIVGAHLPLATGIALSLQYKEQPGTVLCFFGDGSTNTGYFHESLNMAGVWDLPILWLCENNQYGMGTAVSRASAVEEMVQKAQAYNYPTDRVDGMDVLAVKAATEKALTHIQAGNGPYFLEVLTYRYRGHSMGDPERYRSADEIDKRREDDPIGRFHNYLTTNGLLEEDLDAIETQVDEQIVEAERFARESPLPTQDDLYANVYV